MQKYEILDASGGNVINTILADAEFCAANFEFYREVMVGQPMATQRILTKLEYMNRFTDAELAGIYTAAKSVIQVEIWLEKFKLATEINLDDPVTADGLQAMEVATLLAPGRATEILS